MTGKKQQKGGLDEGDIHGALSNDRRRMVIELLEEHGELSARELSERIAADETGEDPPPRAARQSAYVSLKQTHLDHLEELDVVSREAGDDAVRLAEGAEAVTAYMGPLRRFRLAWSEYYAAVGLLGFLAIVAADLGVPPFSAVEDGTLALGFFVLVFASAAYQMLVDGDGRLA